MKKILVLLCCFVMFFGVAHAETDFSIIPTEDLINEYNRIISELTKREELNTDSNLVLYNENDIIIVLNNIGKEISHDKKENFVSLQCTIINNSSSNYEISLKSASINGWMVSYSGASKTLSHHKEQKAFWIKMNNANIAELNEIEVIDIQFGFYKDGDRLPNSISNVISIINK